MASTFPIPLTTLTPGTHTFGPAAVPDADTQITLTITRNVTGGLDSQPGTTTLTVAAEESNDGGTTWLPLASAGTTGGPQFNRYTGQQQTTFGLDVTLMRTTGRQVRAVVTVTGTSVAVQGTLTTS